VEWKGGVWVTDKQFSMQQADYPQFEWKYLSFMFFIPVDSSCDEVSGYYTSVLYAAR
jgi:hypothetical protein